MQEHATYTLAGKSNWQIIKSVFTGFCTATLLMTVTSTEVLAAPAANSVIGNQATATYLDGSSQPRTATSNLVETVVAQVAGVDIEADLSKTATLGGTVNYPHIITNTGNGVDTFDLTVIDANTGTIALGSLVIYADADQNGVPDNFTPITVTTGLNPGDTFGIVVATTVPGSGPVSGDAETITVTAASQFNPAVSDANTDTVTVTGNAVIEVTKAINVTSGTSPNGNPGDPDDPITVTLTYTNNGIGTATGVIITDTLPAGMTYVANSGLWSGAALVDATGANDPAGIDYDGGDTTANEIIAMIASVPQGQSGTIKFDITIDGSLAPGAINNIASFEYNDGSSAIPPVDTNTGTYTVLTTVAVDLTDAGSSTDADATNGDILISGPVAQGSTLLFDNILINNGNDSDTFDVELSGSTFPAGTTFVLYQGDASGNPVAPMTNSNTNGIPDTGPLAAGATYHVVVQATLPTNASGGPFTVTKTATSTTDTNVTSTVTDTIALVEDMVVDMTNDPGSVDSAGVIGAGAGPEGTAITTESVDPGTSATFTLLLENTSLLSSDNYDLDASTDSSFATVSLPAGWSVVFRDGATAISSIVVPANTTTTITAEISVPANELPAPSPGTSIYFRAASSTSGAVDIKHDAIIVNTIHDLAIASSNTGQVFPGGIVEYPFSLTNDGNAAETAATLSASNGNALWISTPQIYHDRNGNGVIDAGEPIVTDLSAVLADGGAAGGATANLDPGESVNLITRVQAPASAGSGDTNDTTVTVTLALDSDAGNDSLTDSSTVVSGDVTVTKSQGLDVNCDGDLLDAGDVAFTTGQINSAAAVPGACVLYMVTATNTGSTSVSSVVVTDPTPGFTTYGCDTVSPQLVNNCAASGTGTVTTPALGAAGVITDTVGPLVPAASSTLTFGVKINP